MALCEVCNNLQPKGSSNLCLDIVLTDLETSARARNCLVCNMIWDGKTALETLPGRKLHNMTISTLNSTVPHYSTSDETLAMHVRFENGENTIYEFYSAQDYKSLNVPHPFTLIHSKTHFPADTGSNLSSSWVLEKLQHCLKTHTSCQYQKDAPLPKRVLDLRAPSGLNGSVGDLKLYVSQGERSSYFCLSHCWGGSLPICTTRATLEEYQSGISWSLLPKTFQDAIVFTRRLGVHFLWIDSMCIIQDDHEDWQRESGQMSAIYQNATLVLGAVISQNGKGGCFSTIPSHSLRHRLQVNVDGHSLEFYLRKQMSHFDYPTAIRWDDVSLPPLLTRAWAFQERILARRFVFFLSGELVWECSEDAMCECSGSEIIESAKLRDLKALIGGDVGSCWRHWVDDYCELNLTFPSDKLPAISGLAKYFSSITNSPPESYLAGLWKNSLAIELLWFARKQNPRPAERRAPTWSWASVDSNIYFECFDLDSEPTLVIDGRCIPKGLDPFGQVSSGYLILSGLVIEVFLQYTTRTSGYRLNSSPWRIKPAFNLSTGENFHEPHLDTPWDLTSRWSNVEPETLQYEEVLYCLKIGTRSYYVYYLLLKSVDGEENTYERVGTVYTGGQRHVSTLWKGCSNTIVKII